MPPPNASPKKLPPWAWVVAIGGGLLVGYFLLRRSSGLGGGTDAALGGGTSAGGGGSGIGASKPAAPFSPVATPIPGTVSIGTQQVSTLQDPATAAANPAPLETSTVGFAAASFAPGFVQESNPYVSAPPLPTYDATQTTLPAFDLANTRLPTFHLVPNPTPNMTGADPNSYGGVLAA